MNRLAIQRGALFGVASGMRASAPLVAEATAERPKIWYALIGELFADKLPFAPSRLEGGGLPGRVLTASYAAYRDARGDVDVAVLQAAVAAAAAIAGAKVAFETRAFLTKRAGLPDLLVALAEDALTLACVVRLRSPEGRGA